MSDQRSDWAWAPSRRDFLLATGLTALDLGWSSVTGALPSAKAATATPGAPNILLIVNDQEGYMDRLPPGYHLPGKDRLLERGTSFTNQQIASCVCTSSRSNMYTGQHIQQTRMFDNLNFPWADT